MGMIYKRGKVYWVKYYRNGKPYRESTRSNKEADAKRLLKKREGEISNGKLPGVYFDRVRFEELAEDFLLDRELKRGQGSRKEAEKRLKSLRRHFSDLKGTQITTAEIKRYIKKRLDEGKANASINRELAALRRMLNLGTRHEPPKVDRVPYVPRLEENNVKEGFLESEEYLKLLAALPPYIRPVLTFGYRTGWRREEISELTWNRIDLKERLAVKLVGETKNKEPRAIYLDDELLKLLRIQRMQAPQDCRFVFFNPGGRKINDFRYPWNRACREAGLGYGYSLNPKYTKKWEEEGLKAGPTFHDLRRTAARNLIRSGVDRDVVKRITGHKSDLIFSRYNIVSANDLKEAAIKQDTFLSGHNYGHSR